jgi:predicted kinase
MLGYFGGTAMLVVFGGLPATGKTTIARQIAARRSAAYLRVDEIEQAIRAAGVLSGDIGPAGYFVANALAASNLANGLAVVADCVNPVTESRQGWRETAARAQARIIEIEVVCSDPVEHRRRVETRDSDIDGLILPSWQAVLERNFSLWEEPHLIVDTANLAPSEAIALVEQHMNA